MKLKLIGLVLALAFPTIAYGDQEVDTNSPEGWAMAFMTSSALNVGQLPPKSVSVGDLWISSELSSIPRLTKEQQRVGFGGFKDEDLNKSPAFGRLRANIGLPWNISAELSWTPPLQINDSKPDHLWGAALSRPLITGEKIDIGLRLFMLRGGVTASVTCSADTIKFEPYTADNTVGCVGLSNDKLQMDHQGVEAFLSFNNSSALLPWISLASTKINNSVKIDAPLEALRERGMISSSGTIQTLSVGFSYNISERWSFNASSSYTPLDAQRPNKNSDNDNFWNVRIGAAFQY